MSSWGEEGVIVQRACLPLKCTWVIHLLAVEDEEKMGVKEGI